jgi:hypothetical protein
VFGALPIGPTQLQLEFELTIPWSPVAADTWGDGDAQSVASAKVIAKVQHGGVPPVVEK